MYDFEVYTGKTGAETDKFGLGVSSGFVMRLAEDIHRLRNYKTFLRRLVFLNWSSKKAQR